MCNIVSLKGQAKLINSFRPEIDETCPLCILEKLTEWIHEDAKWLIIICKTCNVPMYVWKSHQWPSDDAMREMYRDAERRYPNGRLDARMRQLPDHFHFHVREK